MTLDQGVLFTYRNHYLFSDYYLDRRAGEQQEWREADAGAGSGSSDRAVAPVQAARGQRGADTEADWIRPVLAALGHHFNIQMGVQTPWGAKISDYAFYLTTEEIAIVEGKEP